MFAEFSDIWRMFNEIIDALPTDIINVFSFIFVATLLIGIFRAF